MTHDELLAKIDSDIAKTDAVVGLQFCRPTLKALRAVAELHKPKREKGVGFDQCSVCIEAKMMGGRYEHYDVAYPCDTIQAIEKELS